MAKATMLIVAVWCIVPPNLGAELHLSSAQHVEFNAFRSSVPELHCSSVAHNLFTSPVNVIFLMQRFSSGPHSLVWLTASKVLQS